MSNHLGLQEDELSSGDAEGVVTPTAFLTIGVAFLALLSFLQQPGRIVHDTRLDLIFDPFGFLTRSWNLWDQTSNLGVVRNQAVGYLFPMGPFFGVGHLLGLPVWIVERAWLAVLLAVAYVGFIKLVDALHVGTVPARVLGGMAYAFSPVILTRLGTVSGFVIAAAFLPWTIIPLIAGSRSASPRRSAALSGVAVLFVGGINATITFAALLPAAIFLLTRAPSPRRRSLMRWWVVSVACACLWWFGPLVFQSAFGENFLWVTERARTTTSATAPFDVLRGTAEWLAYFRLGPSGLPAGGVLVRESLAILGTGLVVAAGLFGLARRDMKERTFLVLTLAVGAVLVSMGYGGLLGNPLAGPVNILLDGPMALFRSVYKFSIVITLPVMIGFVHVLGVASERFERRNSRQLVVLVSFVALCAVLAGALPMLLNKQLRSNSFEDVPQWWEEVADAVHDQPGRTLLVPGLPNAFYTWGYTQQIPIEWLDTPWASRSLATGGSPDTTAYLDAIESAISNGGDQGLVEFLRRGGFSTVVAQNDAAWQRSFAPSPEVVNAALIASGLVPIGGFGPEIIGTSATGVTGGQQLRMLVLFEVPEATKAAAYDLSSAAVVSGGPEAPFLLDSLGFGARGYLLARDLTDRYPQTDSWIVTDTNRRRFTSYGLSRDNSSYELGPDELAPDGSDPTLGMDPKTRIENQTVAGYSGVDYVRASSYGSWLLSLPESSPSMALDGEPQTAWTTGAAGTATGSWIEVGLKEPISVSQLQVTLLEDGPWRPSVYALKVTTAQGSVITKVEPTEQVQTIAVPPGPTKWIRVSFADVSGGANLAGAGIRELTIPGVTPGRFLQVPSELNERYAESGSRFPVYVFSRTTANPHSLLRSDAESSISRRFDAPRQGAVDLQVRVRAQRGEALLGVLDSTPTFRISSTSTLKSLPEYAPRHLVDGDPGSVWIASRPVGTGLDSNASRGPEENDAYPKISMSWSKPRTISRIDIDTVGGYSRPSVIRIEAAGQVREFSVDGLTTATFDPITTTDVEISFPSIIRTISSQAGQRVEQPLALGTLAFPAVRDLAPGPIDPNQQFEVSCAEGPLVVVNGVARALRVKTTFGALQRMDTVEAEVCDPSNVPISSGGNSLDTAMGPSPFAVQSVVLADPNDPLPAVANRQTEVSSWDDSDRVVDIGPGGEALLAVNETFNVGWKASLNGTALQAVKIDGWRQGFVVPAGDGGSVKLTYGPTRPFRASLVLGGLLVLLLFGLGVLPDRRGAFAPAPERRLSWKWLVAFTAIASVVVGGLAVLLAVPLWFIAKRQRTLIPLIAGGAYAAATVIASLGDSGVSTTWLGSRSTPATILTIFALLGVLVALCSDAKQEKFVTQVGDANWEDVLESLERDVASLVGEPTSSVLTDMGRKDGNRDSLRVEKFDV